MYATRPQDHSVIQAGMAVLLEHIHIWEGSLPNELPVGIELLLPPLPGGAGVAGLIIPREPYTSLLTLGRQRRRMIANIPIRAGTTPVHAWEGWGETPDAGLFDQYGGIGHSPAATAAWLRATSGRD